jgi:hypothetical protein
VTDAANAALAQPSDAALKFVSIQAGIEDLSL